MTVNVADFPAMSTEPYEIEVITPDEFLLDLPDLAPAAVIEELQRQCEAYEREPRTLEALGDALARAGVARFVAAVVGRNG